MRIHEFACGRTTDLPNEDCDVILVAIIRRDRRNGSSNGYSAIGLNKASTKKVVTSGCPVRVTLHRQKNLQIFIKGSHFNLFNCSSVSLTLPRLTLIDDLD